MVAGFLEAKDLKRKGLERSKFLLQVKRKGIGDVRFHGRGLGYITARHMSREAKATENPKRHHINPNAGHAAQRHITSPSVILAEDCQVSLPHVKNEDPRS